MRAYVGGEEGGRREEGWEDRDEANVLCVRGGFASFEGGMDFRGRE